MSYKGRGWNKRELADAGLKTEDGEPLLQELVSEEQFMAWREYGKRLMVSEKDRQWALGRWIVEGEEMKEIAGITVDQRFKNAVYKSARDITGHSIQAIKSLAYVVRHVDETVKDEFKVSFAHLKLVAQYDQQKQREFLSQIERSNLNVEEARDKIRFLTGAMPRPKPKEAGDKKRFLTGTMPKRKSKAERRAAQITLCCDKLMAELDNEAAATLELQSQLIFILTTVWHRIEEVLEEESMAALVSNQRASGSAKS